MHALVLAILALWAGVQWWQLWLSYQRAQMPVDAAVWTGARVAMLVVITSVTVGSW